MLIKNCHSEDSHAPLEGMKRAPSFIPVILEDWCMFLFRMVVPLRNFLNMARCIIGFTWHSKHSVILIGCMSHPRKFISVKWEITLEDTFTELNLGRACRAEEVQDVTCVLRKLIMFISQGSPLLKQESFVHVGWALCGWAPSQAPLLQPFIFHNSLTVFQRVRNLVCQAIPTVSSYFLTSCCQNSPKECHEGLGMSFSGYPWQLAHLFSATHYLLREQVTKALYTSFSSSEK